MKVLPFLKAKMPFHFHTSFVLEEATGLRAATVPQLIGLLRKVPEECIYHHTHNFLLTHHYLTPEPANDFAYWVGRVLGDPKLGYLLAHVDTMKHVNLEDLKQTLVKVMEDYISKNPSSRMTFVAEGEEFFFLKSRHIIVPTKYKAWTLSEFAKALPEVSVNSIYFHMFGARLRIKQLTNDFAIWFKDQLSLTELSQKVSNLDPYAQTLENLRSSLLELIDNELGRYKKS